MCSCAQHQCSMLEEGYCVYTFVCWMCCAVDSAVGSAWCCGGWFTLIVTHVCLVNQSIG